MAAVQRFGENLHRIMDVDNHLVMVLLFMGILGVVAHHFEFRASDYLEYEKYGYVVDRPASAGPRNPPPNDGKLRSSPWIENGKTALDELWHARSWWPADENVRLAYARNHLSGAAFMLMVSALALRLIWVLLVGKAYYASVVPRLNPTVYSVLLVFSQIAYLLLCYWLLLVEIMALSYVLAKNGKLDFLRPYVPMPFHSQR